MGGDVVRTITCMAVNGDINLCNLLKGNLKSLAYQSCRPRRFLPNHSMVRNQVHLACERGDFVYHLCCKTIRSYSRYHLSRVKIFQQEVRI